MPKNKLDKKIPALEAKFENILVCNNKNLRPFVEIFVFEPENATQKNLGSLMGVLEISDNSEDSSYIVNYLSSVIKKEYFSKPKRPSIESFEAALHKANLALAKLAEHGNIQWLGKLNAIVAIIEKNNLHISQAGTTSAFLLRAKGLTDISEGLSASELEPNPLKTFVNVSSGRLENNDKLIVATESIFDIFSLEEIKKSALRFSSEKFIQFLKTALINELEKAAVLVVDIQEKEIAVPAPYPAPEQAETINAFSQAAFFRETRKAPRSKTSGLLPEEISKEIAAEIKSAAEDSSSGKNGHIYIKESPDEDLNVKIPNEYMISLEEKASALKKNVKKLSLSSGAFVINAAKKISLPKFNLKSKKSGIQTEELPGAAPKTIEPEAIEPEIAEPETKESVHEETFYPENPKTEVTPFFEKFKSKVSKENVVPPTTFSRITPKEDQAKNSFIPKVKMAILKIRDIFSSLKPDFSKLKNIVKFDYQQKVYAILALLAIIFIPLLYIKLSHRFAEQPVSVAEPATEIVIPLSQDKNVVRLESLNPIYSGDNIASVQNLNGKFFAVSQAQIIALENQESFPIPQDFDQVRFITAMDDLNLIFIFNQENKALSFSPVSKKFQANTLEIPGNSAIAAAGTYLTYLYLIDAQNSQIYRFPRATSGFGTSTNWLKDTIDLSQTSGMALSDNIFIANGKDIIKLFKGKKQDFNLEISATPIAASRVYIKPDSQNIYVLDKQNSRIVKLDTNGAIISQYYNAEIGSANDFTVDETNNIVYIATPNAVKSFSTN